MPDYMSQDDALRNRPRSVAEDFGEKNVIQPAYDDGPPMVPDKRSTAAAHTGRRRQGEAAAAQERRDAVLYNHARTVAEDEALERSTRRILDEGKPPLPHDATLAAAAARRNLPPVPTADQLAAKVRARRQDQPQDHDQEPTTARGRQQRRHGRRPRSSTAGPYLHPDDPSLSAAMRETTRRPRS